MILKTDGVIYSWRGFLVLGTLTAELLVALSDVCQLILTSSWSAVSSDYAGFSKGKSAKVLRKAV